MTKKALAMAVLNFAGVIALFALVDMCMAQFRADEFVRSFTRPFHMGYTGAFAIFGAVLAYTGTGRRQKRA